MFAGLVGGALLALWQPLPEMLMIIMTQADKTCICSRRRVVVGGSAALVASATPAGALDSKERGLVDEALRMKSQSIASGDQPFGAVVVLDGAIAGYGPSRVIVDSDPNAHAERIAIRDAQIRLGRAELHGAILYSTSRPCSACERSASAAGIAEMRYGPAATSAGRPGTN